MNQPTKTSRKNLSDLARCGFSTEESAILLQLRYKYQTGGSDRFTIVRHWEFLKFLVQTGRLDAKEALSVQSEGER